MSLFGVAVIISFFMLISVVWEMLQKVMPH